MVITLPIGYKFRNGEYTIVKHLAHGGFSCNYLVETNSNKPKVIKELFHTPFCERGQMDGQTVIVKQNAIKDFDKLKAAFKKEATMTNEVKHKHIVDADLIFEENNTVCLVFDYIAGENLEKTITQVSTLSLLTAIDWMYQIGDILQTMHDASGTILHLDCKPTNIVIDQYNTAHLIDFGISRHITDISANNNLYFTPNYSSFDQQKGIITKQNDIYGLGATAYYLLTGSAPMDAEERQLNNDPLVPPSQQNKSIPAVFDSIILKAMSLVATESYDSIAQFTAALKQAVEKLPKETKSKVITYGFKKPVSSKEESTLLLKEIEEEKLVTLPKITIWKDILIVLFFIAIGGLLYFLSKAKQTNPEVNPVKQVDTLPVNPITDSSLSIDALSEKSKPLAKENTSSPPKKEASQASAGQPSPTKNKQKIKNNTTPSKENTATSSPVKSADRNATKKITAATLKQKGKYVEVVNCSNSKQFVRVKNTKNKYGIADLHQGGALVIPDIYVRMDIHYVNGIAIAKKQSNQGFALVTKNNNITAFKYDGIVFNENNYQVFDGNEVYCISQEGEKQNCP